jgi:NADP-dependent 3-hydroxy acid dehydrogenase YdfG
LVAGGSGGIGKAIGRKLCRLGYHVVLTARREVPLRAAAEEIGARYVVADAAEPATLQSAVESTASIDLLVYAAGFSVEPTPANKLSTNGARPCRRSSTDPP